MDMFDRVKLLAKQKGTTIEGILASAGAIPLNTYNGWRKRNILPRADECLVLAKALGTSVEFLVTGKERDSFPPRIQTIAIRCLSASEEDLALIERVLRIEAEKKPEGGEALA